jgi:hypothetical protein
VPISHFAATACQFCSVAKIALPPQIHSPILSASRAHPCWHSTHFPHEGEEYTCIGVAFSHGLFDGMGISYVVHALEAEMHGREWEAPHSIHKGLTVNVPQESLDLALAKSSSQDKVISTNPSLLYSFCGIFGNNGGAVLLVE